MEEDESIYGVELESSLPPLHSFLWSPHSRPATDQCSFLNTHTRRLGKVFAVPYGNGNCEALGCTCYMGGD